VKWGAFKVPVIIFLRIFHIHRASPISGVRIAAPIVLTHQKGYERIGEAQTPIRHASHIVEELA
jgi:hypothetical protein